MIAQLGGNLLQISQGASVTKETMAGVVPESSAGMRSPVQRETGPQGRKR